MSFTKMCLECNLSPERYLVCNLKQFGNYFFTKSILNRLLVLNKKVINNPENIELLKGEKKNEKHRTIGSKVDV